MTKYLTTLLATALLVGMSILPATAQDELTLDDCIEIALRVRGTVLQTRGAEEIAAAGKLSALGAFLPRVAASYSYSKGDVTDIIEDEPDSTGQIVPVSKPDRDSENKRLSIGADVALINVPNWFSYAGDRNNHKASQLDVIASELDLVYSVKSAYFSYLANVENVETNEEALKRSREQLKLIESKYDLGSASLSDVLKQRVQVGTDRIELLRAQNAITSSKANLAYTVGLDPIREYSFASVASAVEYDGTLEDAVATGLANSPVLGSSEATVGAASKYVNAALAGYLPTVSGSWDYSRFDGLQLGQFSSEQTSTSIGFSVGWNIFDGFLREESVVRQKVFRNNARAAHADNTNFVIQNIKTAYLNVSLYKEQTEVAQQTVESASEDLKITQEKYNLGAATILDLLESQVALKRAEQQLISADFNQKTAIADLQRWIGGRQPNQQ